MVLYLMQRLTDVLGNDFTRDVLQVSNNALSPQTTSQKTQEKTKKLKNVSVH